MMVNAESTKYYTEFSTFGDYNMAGKTFYVIPGNSNISINDLEFKYYADIIKQCIIRDKGIPTDDFDNADFCVLMDYGLTDESYVATQSIPIWGRTGIASVTTTSNTTANVYGNSYGTGTAYGYSSGNSAYGTASGSSYGSAHGSSTTTTTQNYNYNYGVTGYREQSYKVTSYRRVLNLYAYDNKVREGEPIMLWKANAVSDGSSDDLATVIVYMANEMYPYIGGNTNGKRKYYERENSPDVLCMKKKFYLRDDVVVNPKNRNIDDGCESIFMRAVHLAEDKTSVFLMGTKANDRNSLKIPKLTYLIFKGERYLISSIILPFEQHFQMNMLNKYIPLYYDVNTLIRLDFPVKMQKGDTFDIVSYINKKETRELFHYRGIVLE
jgi:hypothetical protein